jgi:methylglyoxal synthase
VSDTRHEFEPEPWGDDQRLVELLGERGQGGIEICLFYRTLCTAHHVAHDISTLLRMKYSAFFMEFQRVIEGAVIQLVSRFP